MRLAIILLLLIVPGRLCIAQDAPVKTVGAAELRRLVRRATAVTVTEQSGRKVSGTGLGLGEQRKMTVADATGVPQTIDCTSIREIELKSTVRSVGPRVAEWIVVGGGGALSIAAGVGAHPAFFGGVPAVILAGRRIVKQSKREKRVVVLPRCSTFR